MEVQNLAVLYFYDFFEFGYERQIKTDIGKK